VLDLFAGTGALGIEALSRGASFVLFVDKSREAGRNESKPTSASVFTSHKPPFIRQDLALSYPEFQCPILTLPRATRFDLVFMDPPYAKKLAEPLLTKIEKTALLAPGALIVIEEHRNARNLPTTAGTLTLINQRRYGETGLWFYQLQSP
jgi:16S rRNA (guanine966-N2)-methyltransferase